MNTHNHRIAIVTGASRERGIGTAICRALAAAGADIFFTHWGTYDAAMPWGAEKDWPVCCNASYKQWVCIVRAWRLT